MLSNPEILSNDDGEVQQIIIRIKESDERETLLRLTEEDGVVSADARMDRVVQTPEDGSKREEGEWYHLDEFSAE